MYLVRGANYELEFVEPYYYSVRTYDDGSMQIENLAPNYVHVMNENGSWTLPKETYTVYEQGREVTVSRNIYTSVSADGAIISGGSNKNTIKNEGNNVQINGGADDDHISNYGSNGLINCGAGYDTVYNYGDDTKINNVAGKTYIYNGDISNYAGIKLRSKGGDNVEINGGSDYDYIFNTASNVTINGGAGGDYIKNDFAYSDSRIGGDHVTIKGGAGDDTISAGDALSFDIFIDSGAGNDYVLNGGKNVVIILGDGDDDYHDYVGGENLTADGGNGNDTIHSNHSNSSIYGGAGDDYISGSGLLDGGAGDDYISGSGLLDGGSGNDTIYGGSNSTIYGGTDNDYIKVSGNNISVDAGSDEGCDTVSNSGTSVTISTGAGMDSIFNSASNVTIDTGVGNDSISNSGDNVSINAGKGDDLIEVYGNNVTVQSGGDKDTIKYTRTSNGSFCVEDFDSGDVIEFDNRVEVSNTIDGGVVVDYYYDDYAKKVTINGITISSEETGWTLDKQTHEASYGYKKTAGNAKLSEDKKSIVYEKNSAEENISVKLGGIASTGNMEPQDDVIPLAEYNFFVDGASVLSNTGDYSFALGGYDFNEKTFTGSDNSDSISNAGANVTIDGAGGDDVLESSNFDRYSTYNIRMNGSAGNDTINNRVRETTIDGGADNDYIKNFAWHGDISGLELNVYESEKNSYDLAGHVSINGGGGNNTIENGAFRWHRKDNVIESDGERVTIHADNAVLEESILGGDDVTITAGAGNDMIQSYGGSRVTINAGGGNNFVSVGGGENISVKAEDKDDTIVAHGVKDIFGTVADNDKLDGGSNLTIEAGDGKNFISVASSWSNVTVEGGGTKGADAIFNGGDSALIKGNAGLDVIENKGDFAIVLGGEDGDLLTNYGNNVYMQGDDGKGKRPSNDYIFTNSGDLVTIDAGKDDDTIEAYHDTHASISGGDGHDYILLQRYSAEDVNKIVGAVFQTGCEVGKSVLESKYGVPLSINSLFMNAAEILYAPLGLALNALDTAYGIFSGVKAGAAYAEEMNSESTVSGGKGNDTIINDGLAPRVFEYSAGDGSDTIYNFNANKLSNASLSTLHIKKGYIEEVEVNYANEVIVRVDDANLIKVGDESIKLIDGANKEFYLKEADGTTTRRAYAKNSATGDVICSIFGGAENDVLKDNAANASQTHYYLTSGGGDDELYGNAQADTLYAFDGKNTLYGGAGNDSLYSEAQNNKFYGDAGNDTIFAFKSYSTISGGADSDLISLRPAAHQCVVEYNNGDGNDIVYGFDSNDTLKISGGKYSMTTSGEDLVVKVGDGSITFKYCKNLSINIDGEEAPSWALDYKGANYGTSEENLIAVSGVKSVDGISLNGNVVTLSKKSLGEDNVTVSEGYTLKLGSDVTKSKTTNAWNLNKTTATYKQTTSAGYTLKNNTITYTKKSTKTLATVKGVKNLGGISLKKKVITLSDSALNKGTVTVSGDYTLRLGSDVTKSKMTTAWNLNKTTATYKQTTSAGYTLKNNTITYTKKSTKTLATVKGVKNLGGISLKKKVITLSDSALNKGTVTVSGDYTLRLGSDVTKSKMTTAWNLNKTTATYKQTTSAGYTLKNNTITYTKKSTKTLATVKGVKNLGGISLKKKVITLKKSSLANKVTVNGSGYEFNFAAGDYKKTLITGSTGKDTITSHGKNLLIDGGAGDDKLYGGTGNNSLWGGAGNDTLYSGIGADKFIYGAGDGKDVIFGFDDKDTLTLDNLDFAASYSKKNQAVTFKVAGGSITLKDFTATTFHINGDIYKISGSKFKKI